MQGAADVSDQASVVNGNDKAETAESEFLRWSLAHTGAKSTLVSNNFGLQRLPISCLSFLAFFCHRLHMFCFFSCPVIGLEVGSISFACWISWYFF